MQSSSCVVEFSSFSLSLGRCYPVGSHLYAGIVCHILTACLSLHRPPSLKTWKWKLIDSRNAQKLQVNFPLPQSWCKLSNTHIEILGRPGWIKWAKAPWVISMHNYQKIKSKESFFQANAGPCGDIDSQIKLSVTWPIYGENITFRSSH